MAVLLNERLDTAGRLALPNGYEDDNANEIGSLTHAGLVQLDTSCNCGKENDVMGMIANWIHQVTMPLRDLRWRFYRLKDELTMKLFSKRRMKDGIISDVRQLGHSVGVGRKPKAPPNVPPSPPPKPQRRRR